MQLDTSVWTQDTASRVFKLFGYVVLRIKLQIASLISILGEFDQEFSISPCWFSSNAPRGASRMISMQSYAITEPLFRITSCLTRVVPERVQCSQRDKET